MLPAFVTRTGVLTYRRADGTLVRELRHPDHVFRTDSLDTLRDAPVTVGHPGEGQTWVDPDNARDHEVGVVHDAQREGAYVSSRLSVRRADTIRRIDAKELVEVSAAYDADIDPTPGTYEGQAYDQVQTNIRYNHVALLPPGKGRCGSDVRLRADSADAVVNDVCSPNKTDKEESADTTDLTKQTSADASDLTKQTATRTEAPAQGGNTMSTRKLRVDGVEYELPETTASVLEKAVQDRDAHKKRADEAEAKVSVMEGQLQAARDPKTIAGFVTRRVELERSAAKVLGPDKRFDGLTDRQILEQALAVASPSFKCEGRSDDAITAAFECALENAPKVNKGLQSVTGTTPAPQTGTTPAQPTETRADGSDAQPDIWAQFDQLEQKRQSAWQPRKGA